MTQPDTIAALRAQLTAMQETLDKVAGEQPPAQTFAHADTRTDEEKAAIDRAYAASRTENAVEAGKAEARRRAAARGR